MANVGPQCTSASPTSPPQMPVPFPSCTHRHADVTPFLMCSGLMVVGHCLDCYSLLSVVFAVFHGHPVTVPSHRTSSHPPHAHPPDVRPPQLGPFVMPCLSGITLSRQFAISLSHRSECFFIALRCFRVSSSRLPGSLSWGSRPCVPKGVEGKVEEDTLPLISCVLTHLQHPRSTPPSPSHPPLLSSPRPPTAIHQVADCLFARCLWAIVAISVALDRAIILEAPSSLPGLGITDMNITINTSVAAFLSLPALPATMGYIYPPLPPHCSPSPQHLPCIKYFH